MTSATAELIGQIARLVKFGLTRDLQCTIQLGHTLLYMYYTAIQNKNVASILIKPNLVIVSPDIPSNHTDTIKCIVHHYH